MLFIRAMTIKEKASIDNLMSLQMLGTPSYAASSGHPVSMLCRSYLWKCYPILFIQAVQFHCQTKGIFT